MLGKRFLVQLIRIAEAQTRANQLAHLHNEILQLSIQQDGHNLVAIRGCHEALVALNNNVVDLINRPTPDADEVVSKVTQTMKDTLTLMAAGSVLGKEEVEATPGIGSLIPTAPRIAHGMAVKTSLAEIDDTAIPEG